jgi:mono/diheme cytochrome c family protein
MKKLLKILGILVLSILGILLIIISYIKIALPNVGPAPQMTIERTPERIARGNYLAKSVMACMDCHSKRDITQFTMPLIASSLGEGGERFDQTLGFPGIFFAANITPSGIGSWTDGEVYRAITTGVRKNGKPIFPVMPYHSYGFTDPEDVKSMITYLRSLTPIENVVPESSADFPMNIILNTIPKKAEPITIPPAGDSVGNGRYLLTIGACHDCHTPFVNGKFDETLSMAGGRSFPVPGGTVTSANLTSDKTTGIGSWNKEIFVQHFAMYRDSATAHRVVNPGDLQTVMPWTLYGNMTDKDLANIYAYLQTLQPVNHLIVKWKPAK